MPRGGGPVLGRVHWDDKHCSGWMQFPNITAFRLWSRELRGYRPEVRTEYELYSIPGPENLLSSAREEAAYRAKQLKQLI